jgi:shikimate kinase
LKKNLVLTGMMGVGKSTIGQDLAGKLDMQFKDIDKIIEEKLSLSIADIFEKKGEAFFRKIEEEETLNHIKEKNAVVALGGGAFMSEKIRENTKKLCISVWLDLEPKHLFPRIKVNKRRPLLNSKSSEQDLKNLYEKRKKTYSLANYKIDCNLKTRNEVVKEILKIYESI